MRIGWVGLAFVAATVGIIDSKADAQAQQPPPRKTMPSLSHVAPIVLRNVPDPVNVQHLQALRARVPVKCGPHEAAPGVWVRVDCHNYAPVPGAKRLVITTARMNLIKRSILGGHPAGSDAVKGGAPVPGGDRAGSASSSDDVPGDVDHRRDGTEGPMKNQEYTSMCTGFSLSSTMDNAILRLGGSDVTSPTHLWAHYGSPHMASAATGNLNKPIAMWGTWPFSPRECCALSRFDDDCGDHYNVRTNSAGGDRKIQTELQSAESSGRYKITSIEAMSIPANPDEVAAVLATGADLWVAFSLDVSHWGYRVLQTNHNVITDWSDPEGGHAVMLAGYRTVGGKKQFLIHNSWGTDWGDGGYAWVSDRMVARFMHAAYKIKVESIGGPVALTDDDCDMDELVDSVTGKCAPTCDDDSRRANGQCAGDSHKPAAPSPAACPQGTAFVNGVCKPVHTFMHR